MTKRARIETAFEIARVFIYGDRWRDRAAWCAECETYVPAVTTLTAAALGKTNVAEVFRRVEAGEIHGETKPDGTLLVCLSSMLTAGISAPVAENAG